MLAGKPTADRADNHLPLRIHTEIRSHIPLLDRHAEHPECKFKDLFSIQTQI
ncbi:hypothetical protein [Chamaesiphon sp. VAR_69_metabat_338]|uniref:hypothetical protein n=1 Tax=Chamaesiphon sp. VAR_69_metabat_338 TaxID=2964704 RepID=UPI00286DC4D9|nr:hypothetical protein [Chamaesiphon sp. VAR_69_metabat_338]